MGEWLQQWKTSIVALGPACVNKIFVLLCCLHLSPEVIVWWVPVAGMYLKELLCMNITWDDKHFAS